jgi:hypothetical protein
MPIDRATLKALESQGSRIPTSRRTSCLSTWSTKNCRCRHRAGRASKVDPATAQKYNGLLSLMDRYQETVVSIAVDTKQS